MDLKLVGKTAFVVGGSGGIGAATAKVLAGEGADVAVSYAKNLAGAEQAVKTVRSLGRESWALHLDVASSESVTSAISELGGLVTGIDALVLCAGSFRLTDFDRLDTEEWCQLVEVNLTGQFRVLRAMLPLMREGSSITLVSSVAGQTGAAHHAHYAAAKAGVINLAKSSAVALAPRVRVNCVAPGVTLTPMGMEAVTDVDDYPREKLLVDRLATPEEIGNTIAFVASPISRFMVGATIDINGGRELR